MVRGSSEIFKKLKAMAVISAVLLSAMVMSGISSISTNPTGSSTGGDGTLGDSYADIGRPSFLVPGRYLDYSVNYGLVPGYVNQTTTNLTANLRYTFNSIAGPYYSVTEQTTNLHVSYGYTNLNRTMGFYNTGVPNATLLAEQKRGYNVGPIRASVLNLTNFNVNYSFSTTLNMYTSNGSFGSASGNGTNQIVLDSMISPAVPSPARAYYFGYYRTILSYYKTLSTLYRAPKALFTAVPGFTIDGTATVDTFLGTRSAVKVNRVLNSTYTNLRWQDNLYFDVFTGVLIKAVMYVDSVDSNRFHQIEFNLIGSNLDFGLPTPSSGNEFEDAIEDIKQYLASSALNDTNRSLFHHAAIGGAAAPSNSTKLSADTFKIIFGYSAAFGIPLETLFLETNASILRDVQSGGFYRSMNAGGTTVDGVKTVTDAAWAILGSSVLGSDTTDFQEEMFRYMRDHHYGNGTHSGYTFYAFARYNGTSDPDFYAYDNLIAFLALNVLAFTDGIEASIKTQAKNMTYHVISLFSEPGAFHGFVNGSLFVTSIGRDGNFVNTEKSVLDACLAIFALSQYYLFNQTTSAKTHVDHAIGAFNMLLAKAWNATNKGFVHQLDLNFNVIDANQYLQDNAWALAASLALLEAANKYYPAVKNITYYDVACDTWGAIKKVLYDSQNKTFKAASNNKASLAGDLGDLLFSLSGMLATSRATTLTVATNATDDKFVYEKLKPVKAIATWKLDMTRDMPTGLQPIHTVIPLNYSDVYFKIRYSNRTIYDELFSVTDNTGNASFTFPIPTPPEFTDMDPSRKSATAHLIGVVANRTGFEVKEAFRAFYITSGISVWTDPENPSARFDFTGDKFSAYFNNRTVIESVPSVYPGDTFSVSINLSSSVDHAQKVNITFSGNILNATTTKVVTVNSSAANATSTMQLTVKGDIPTGMQTMNFSISKNGSAILEGEIPVYVKIPVLLTNVKYAAYMVGNSSYDITFNVKNLNKNRNESVNLAFSSVNLEVVGGNASFNITNITPNQEIPVALTFHLKTGAARLNEYQFTIVLSWENVSLGTLVYIIPFRAPIEILAISGPTNPIQGSPLLFTFSLRSNLASSTSVNVIIYRVLNTGATSVVKEEPITLAPGSSNFIVSCKDPLDNPWDIGMREYRVVVLDGSVEVGKETVMSNVQTSLENILLGYILVFGAFGIVFLLIFNKKRQLESVRR